MGLSMDEQLNIHRRILETHTWCLTYLDMSNLKNSLRSRALRPKKDFWHYSTKNDDRAHLVDKLTEKRANKLRKDNVKLVDSSGVSGRILCFYPSLSLQDAVVALTSCGYISPDDNPPWDTWLLYSEEDLENYHSEKEYSCLLSWVPDEAVGLVHEAILEDTYGCLVWAERLEHQLEILLKPIRSNQSATPPL